MGFSEVITIISIVVGIVGIIVGIIGWKSLSTAIEIKNSVKNVHDSTINQAQIINNGLEPYAVIKLTRETTQEELTEIVKRISDAESKLSSVEKKVPKFTVSPNPPTESLGEGHFWIQY